MTYRFRNPELHQEEDHVPMWQVLGAFLVALAISGIIIAWAVSETHASEARLRPSGLWPDEWLGPRHLVAKVREDLFDEQRGASVNGRARAVLDGYGFVDRDRGVVHVPIQMAIDLVVSGRRP